MAMIIGVFILGAAWAPKLWIGIVCAYAIQTLATVLLTGGISIVSLVSPAESRASAFALFEIFSLVGVLALPIVGVVGDAYGIRTGMAVLTPVLLVGGILVATAGRFVNADIARIYPEHAPQRHREAGGTTGDTLGSDEGGL
jgi:branched-chain amino acid transport system ATP-binding protein